MPLLTIFILALIQGVTEFLPISSSGHLVLGEQLMGMGTDGTMWAAHKSVNVAVHLGTLFSVLVYFRDDVRVMFGGLKDFARRDISARGAQLNLHVLIGSVPVIAVGLVLHILEPDWLLSVHIIAWTTLIFGILLWVVDYRIKGDKNLDDLTLRDSFLIGLAQALALLPGTSRSGVSMTAARALGYSRTESAHFSLLLAIIAIAGAGTLGVWDLIKSADMALGFEMLVAALVAFISGWAAIALMMKWLQKCSFAVFGFYRVILGLVLLVFLYYPL